MLPFALPAALTMDAAPEWTGQGFRVGDQLLPVLEYSENFAGWSDDLTSLHEDAIGSSHPIDRASRGDAIRQLQRYVTAASPVIMEIGCSSGFLLKEMKQALPHATLIGADVVREPLYKLAAELPTVPLLRFDLLKCPMPSAAVDAVVMLNVLEHIEDDATALAQVHRILKPGGVVVIEVPAGPQLYDAYDRGLMHFRRYAMAGLSAQLQSAGFEVVRRSHLGFFLYPAFAWVKRRNQRTMSQVENLRLVTEQASKTSSNFLFCWMVAAERLLGRWIDYPIGVRCLVVARKP